jgi:hypothetical protein
MRPDEESSAAPAFHIQQFKLLCKVVCEEICGLHCGGLLAPSKIAVALACTDQHTQYANIGSRFNIVNFDKPYDARPTTPPTTKSILSVLPEMLQKRNEF